MSRDGVWSRALEVARRRIQIIGGLDEAVLIQFGSSADVLTTWLTDRDRLTTALRNRAAPSFETTSYTEGLRASLGQLESAHNRSREILLITDLQAAGLDLQRASDLMIPAEVRLVIEDVGKESPNLYIEQASLVREVFQDAYPNPIAVRLGSSPTAAAVGELRLYLENELIDRTLVELGDSGTASIRFPAFPVAEGITRGRIVLDSSDAIPEDDTYHFVLERRPPSRIELFSSRKAEIGGYLENALLSGANLPFKIRPGVQKASFDVNEIPVLLFNDLSMPASPSALITFLESGGGLVVGLGPSIARDAYNARWSELLPATVTARRYARSTGRPFISITEGSWDHPVLSLFGSTRENALSSVQFDSYWALEPKLDANVLARFSTGDPALVEWPVGEGRVILLASSLDRSWSDFPLRSAYVPFLYRLIQYASKWKPQPASMEVNQVLSLAEWSVERQPGRTRNWDLLDPAGQRVLNIDQDTPEHIQLEQPGYYELRREKNSDWLAVNVDTTESNLERVESEALLSAFQTLQVQSPQLIVSGDGQSDTEQPLWWPVLLAAGAVFLIE
jgi:hypothetical protein